MLSVNSFGAVSLRLNYEPSLTLYFKSSENCATPDANQSAFRLSPVSPSHHKMLSQDVGILFWMLQLGIQVRIRGFFS